MEMAVDLSAVADLPTKYHKLATEYSKMRAQVAVLKKAVIDEQSKVVELKDVLKSREHTLRKNEQEMESLEFRNQQLARRVSILQEELNTSQLKSHGKSKKSNGDAAQAQLANNILGEELQQKIEENARLHQQVYEVDFQHQKVIAQLEEKLRELEKDVKNHDSIVQEINKRNKNFIEKLQQDKLLFEIKLQSAEKEANEANIRANMLQGKLFTTEQSLSYQLEQANLIIKLHLPFVDTKSDALNSINVPRCSGRSRERCLKLVKQIAEVVPEIVSHLSNFHTYLEQRILLCISNDINAYGFSNTSKKLAEYLHENLTYLKEVESSYEQFESGLEDDVFIAVEMTAAFEEFLLKLRNYIQYLKKIYPYLALSFEEESCLSWSPVELRRRNESLVEGWQLIISAFSKIDTNCQLLLCNFNSAARCRAVKTIVKAVEDLLNAIKGICSQYNGKVLLLKDLPVISEKLKTTEECVVSSLVPLVTDCKKLHSILFESIDDVLEEQKNRPFFNVNKTKTKLLANYKKRAINYLTSLDKGPFESVCYAEAIKNNNHLLNSVESRESMTSQLTEAQDKISKLEQMKEYWMLEYQLLKMKHERLQKKFQMDLDNVSVGSEKAISPGKESTAGSPMAINSLLAKLELDSSVDNCSSVVEESEEIRQYFVKRINDLVAKKQLADSKAIAFHSELLAMQKRLVLADKSKTELQNDWQSSNDHVIKLKEELQTTTNNYKSQLSTMSEHLANMNEKLTKQRDEIDDLKYALNNSVSM
ncbi:hypothetical protein CHUAL_009625 [Chamberlinius hualienensis]